MLSSNLLEEETGAVLVGDRVADHVVGLVALLVAEHVVALLLSEYEEGAADAFGGDLGEEVEEEGEDEEEVHGEGRCG